MCVFPRKTGHISETVRDRAKLLLITNSKSHIGFQIIWKLSTLDDLEGQYCNRKCIDCSFFFSSDS